MIMASAAPPKSVPASRAPPSVHTRSVPPARSVGQPALHAPREPGRAAQNPSPRGAAARTAVRRVTGCSPRRRRELGGGVLEDGKTPCPFTGPARWVSPSVLSPKIV